MKGRPSQSIGKKVYTNISFKLSQKALKWSGLLRTDEIIRINNNNREVLDGEKETQIPCSLY